MLSKFKNGNFFEQKVYKALVKLSKSPLDLTNILQFQQMQHKFDCETKSQLKTFIESLDYIRSKNSTIDKDRISQAIEDIQQIEKEEERLTDLKEKLKYLKGKLELLKTTESLVNFLKHTKIEEYKIIYQNDELYKKSEGKKLYFINKDDVKDSFFKEAILHVEMRIFKFLNSLNKEQASKGTQVLSLAKNELIYWYGLSQFYIKLAKLENQEDLKITDESFESEKAILKQIEIVFSKMDSRQNEKFEEKFLYAKILVGLFEINAYEGNLDAMSNYKKLAEIQIGDCKISLDNQNNTILNSVSSFFSSSKKPSIKRSELCKLESKLKTIEDSLNQVKELKVEASEDTSDFLQHPYLEDTYFFQDTKLSGESGSEGSDAKLVELEIPNLMD